MSQLRCTQCQHLSEDEGFAGSDVTGASPPRISCDAGYWEFDFDDARRSLHVIAEAGESCPAFKPVRK